MMIRIILLITLLLSSVCFAASNNIDNPDKILPGLRPPQISSGLEPPDMMTVDKAESFFQRRLKEIVDVAAEPISKSLYSVLQASIKPLIVHPDVIGVRIYNQDRSKIYLVGWGEHENAHTLINQDFPNPSITSHRKLTSPLNWQGTKLGFVELYVRQIPLFKKDRLILQYKLNPDEIAFIEKNPIITVSNFFHEPPFTINKGNIKEGYLYDFLKEIFAFINLRIQYVGNFNSYDSMLEALEKNQIDVLTTIEKEYPLKSNSNIAITKPVLIMPYVLVGKSDAKPISNTKELFGKKVAVVKGYAQDKLLDKFPQIQKVHVKDNEAGFEAIRQGRAKYYLNNRANAEYVIYKKFSMDFKISGELSAKEFPPLTISFGVYRGKPELVSIINKCIENISLQTIKRLNQTWLSGKITQKRAIDVREKDIQTAAKKREKINFTPEEISFIQKHPNIVLGGDKTWGPFIVPDKDGSIRGYDADIIAQINRLTGLHITLEIGKWEDITQKAQQGGLDGLTTSSAQKERAKYFNFSDPYFELRKIAITKNGNPTNIFKLNDLYGKRFGVEKGNLQMEKTAKFYNAGQLIYYDNAVEMIKGLVASEIDVFIGNDVTMYQAIKEGLINYIEPAFFTGQSLNLVFSLRKEWTELISILNKALRHIDEHDKQEILNRWFGGASERLKLTLTSKENAYLKKHPVIKVSNEMDYPPFDFMQNGHPAGYSIDLLNLLANKIGIQVKYINGHTWNEMIEMFKQGDLDLMHALKITPERQKYGLFSDPYRRLKTYYVTPVDAKEIKTIKQLYGKKFAVGKGWFQEEFLSKNYPQIKLVQVNNSLEMLEAVSNRKADVAAGNRDVLQYLIKKHGLNDIKICKWFSEMDNGQAYTHNFMAQKNAPELISMLNKALASLSIEELEKLQQKWLGKSEQKTTIFLTNEERCWLDNNPEATIAMIDSSPPFTYEENGQHKGFENDIISLLSKKTGLIFKPIYNTWANNVNNFKAGKSDIISRFSYKKERKSFTLFTKPYYEMPTVIYVRDDFGEYKGFDSLKGKRVGFLKNIFFAKEIKEYGDIETTEYNTPDEIAKALVYGRIDSAITSITDINYIIKKNAYINLRLVDEFRLPNNFGKEDMRLGINPDKPLLYSILQKGLDAITDQERFDLINKWIGSSTSQPKFQRLSLTKEEMDWLQKHPVVTASNEQHWAPFNFFEDGKPKGFSIDYFDLLAKKAGFKVSYISGPTWKEFCEMIKEKKLDMLLNVAYNKERSDWLEFTDHEYFQIRYGLVVNSTATDINEFKDIFNKRVAIENGFWIQKWLQENNPKVNIKTYADTLEALTAVSLNEADAYVGNVSVVGYLIKKYWLTNVELKSLGETKLKKTNNIYIGVQKGNLILKNILDKAMDAISQEEINQLNSKWFGFSQPQQEKMISLSKQEQAYLQKKRIIKMCSAPGWPPIEWIDKDGKHQGVSADFMNLISKRIKHKIKLIPTKTWNETIENVKAGKCDFISTIVQSDERSKYLNFTNIYQELDVVIATREEQIYIQDIETLSGKKVGVVKNSIYESRLREKYPSINIVSVDDILNGLRMVEKDEIIGFVDNLISLAYTIQKNGLVDLKISGRVGKPIQLRIGVRKDEPMLHAIFEKALDSISAEKRQDFANKWIAVKMEQKVDYTLLWQVMGFAAFIIFGVIYWNRKLASFSNRIAQTNKELAKTQNQLRLITDNIPAYIAYIDAETLKYLFVNRIFLTSFGKKHDEIVGHHVSEIIGKERYEYSLPYVEETKKGKSVTYINTLSPQKGKVWVNINFEPDFDENGKVRAIFVHAHDISERIQAEEDMKKAKEAAEKANQAKSEFIANMSHEIRTPLNAVIGFSELLEQTEITSKQQSYLQSIRTGGKTLLSLINDILDLSKIEAGKMVIETESVNIRRIIADIKHVFAFKIKKKSLKLSLEMDYDVPDYLLLDETRLRQVLFNIVGNAIKFTHEGGIHISVTATPCKSNTNKIDLAIKIQDTGIGIPKEQHDKIFGSFEQQQGQDTRLYGGSGLGLAISKKLVTLMGGEIKLESTLDSGSTFTVCLYHVDIGESDLSNVTQEFKSKEKVCFAPATVLIADDVESNRQFVKSTLSEYGLKIVEAMDGAQAVMLCKEIFPDLILMDIRMPNMNGIKATELIKKEPILAHIPIIALTASVEDEKIKDLFDGFLGKPATPTKLITELQKHLITHNVKEFSEKQPDTTKELSNLPKEILSKAVDKKIITLWHEAMDSGLFADVNAFSKALNNAGETHNAQELINFAQAIQESVENFDVKKLKEMLQVFGELVQTNEQEKSWEVTQEEF